MAQKERDIINERLAGLKANERLFRANCGLGWTGTSTRKGEFLIIKNPRPFHGMPEGMPDLIGWESVEITPNMVGRRLAVFVGEEIKTSGRLRARQQAFKEIIERMGGVFRVIGSPIEKP